MIAEPSDIEWTFTLFERICQSESLLKAQQHNLQLSKRDLLKKLASLSDADYEYQEHTVKVESPNSTIIVRLLKRKDDTEFKGLKAAYLCDGYLYDDLEKLESDFYVCETVT